MLKQLLFSSAQHWLNRLLNLDPASEQQLAQINGKLFLLRCTRPALDFYISIEDGRVALLRFDDSDDKNASASSENKAQQNDASISLTDCVPDTTLEGGAAALLKLLNADEPAAALGQSDISLRGDHASFEKFLALFQNLEADFEAPLSKIIGDVAAHSIGKTVRGLRKSSRERGAQFKRHAEEFILHEAKLSPNAFELDDFQQQVQSLKQDTERLQAKLQKFTNAL